MPVEFYTAYLVALFVSSCFVLGLAAYGWRRRNINGATMFAWSMVVCSGWGVFTIVSVVAGSAEAARFWDAQVRYLFIAAFPIFFFAFTLEYAGWERWLQTRYLALLFVLPVVIQTGNWLDPTSFILSMTHTHVGNYWIVDEFKPAWGFNIHTTYSYLLIASGLGILFTKLFNVAPLYRVQVMSIISGVFVPFIVNILVVMRIVDVPSLDWTVIAFSITGLIWTWALFRYSLFDMMPVAYEMIVRSMDDAVLVLDGQNRVMDLNPAARTILNLPQTTVVGQEVQILFANRQDLLQKYLHVEKTQDEILIGNRTYDLKISTLQRRANRPIGRLVVLRDITDRKRAEGEREHLIQELEAYAHSVAHDLKNPLSVVMGMAELLDEQGQTFAEEKQRQYHQLIVRNSRKMFSIIDELLLLASVRENDHVELRPLDMKKVVEEARNRLLPQIQTAQAEVSIPTGWQSALGYAPWVEEVWVNYLSNALKYGGTPPKIELGAEPQGKFIRFYVRDNGKGLTTGESQLVFKQFTRLDPQRADGHGLGLSIVQRIVQKLGGEVGVESEVGAGSTFYFTLPATNGTEATFERVNPEPLPRSSDDA